MNDPYAAPQNVPQYTSKFIPPPKSNIKVMIGTDAYSYLQYHCQKPPNRFQRWLMHKLLGIKVELIK